MKPDLKFITATVCLFIIHITLWGQTPERTPVGKWKVCVTMDLKDTVTPCETFSFVTYDFYEDGTYTDSGKYIVNGKSYPYPQGSWQYDGNTLTVKPGKIPDVLYRSPIEYPVVWVNDTIFYSEGREGENGPLVYTYFIKVK